MRVRPRPREDILAPHGSRSPFDLRVLRPRSLLAPSFLETGHHRGKPVPKDQAAARPGAAGLGPEVASGVMKLARTRGGRGRCVQHAPGCLEACRASGVSSCEVILSPSEFRLSHLQGYRRWVTGLLLGPAVWPGQPRPERPPSEHLRRGLPGALPGLPVPRMRAGLGRLTARSTQKRQRPLSKLVRAPP